MLKHQLTSASPAEAQLYSPQKLATRANQSSGGQIMLEEHQTNLEVSSNIRGWKLTSFAALEKSPEASNNSLVKNELCKGAAQ